MNIGLFSNLNIETYLRLILGWVAGAWLIWWGLRRLKSAEATKGEIDVGISMFALRSAYWLIFGGLILIILAFAYLYLMGVANLLVAINRGWL